MTRTLLAVLAGVATVLFVLGSGGPAQAVSRPNALSDTPSAWTVAIRTEAASVAAIRGSNNACSKPIRIDRTAR
jgi:hypothetical protein